MKKAKKIICLLLAVLSYLIKATNSKGAAQWNLTLTLINSTTNEVSSADCGYAYISSLQINCGGGVAGLTQSYPIDYHLFGLQQTNIIINIAGNGYECGTSGEPSVEEGIAETYLFSTICGQTNWIGQEYQNSGTITTNAVYYLGPDCFVSPTKPEWMRNHMYPFRVKLDRDGKTIWRYKAMKVTTP